MAAPLLVARTLLTLIAFAANSLLNRAALSQTEIDPATFTVVRLVAGAMTLWIISTVRSKNSLRSGSWLSASALFVYAAAFSFAYVGLTTATGALLLFGAVQASMFAYGLYRGERYRPRQVLGIILAGSGLIYLVMPGVASPPAGAAVLMILAGIAWGVYSIRGQRSRNALADTSGNFLRSLPLALLLLIIVLARQGVNVDTTGMLLAICSGAFASGVGYALWYSVLPLIRSGSAAVVQLSVPVLAAFGGVLFLDETLSTRLVVSSLFVIGGIGLVVVNQRRLGPHEL
jgi:drug/metabolite transporter (DMT)-like permease